VFRRKLGVSQKLAALYEVLANIQASGRTELVPAISLNAGIVYPEALKATVKYGVRDTDLIEDLVKLGALERLYHDSMVACPKCGSIKLFSKLRCPYCGSEHLKKISVVAHATCGGITTLDEGAENAHCSKCGKPLTEMTVIGRLYQCLSCGVRFETPLPAYKCADCGYVFDYREARYVTIHKYRVKRESLDSIAKKLLVEIAREVGETEGFKVEMAVQAKGKSGFQHPVDLAFSDGKETVYLDVVVESPRAMSETLANLAKTPDLQAKHNVLAPKSLESGLQGFAGSNVLTYSDAHDLSEKIKQLLKEGREKGRRS
jgi:DNA-directed RNA polymerase subunit RPC12/RpoP